MCKICITTSLELKNVLDANTKASNEKILNAWF